MRAQLPRNIPNTVLLIETKACLSSGAILRQLPALCYERSLLSCGKAPRADKFSPVGLQFEKKNPRAVISTKFGDMLVKFYPDAAPRHVENFINLVKMGFYNGIRFHRVIPGFMIQGGDPASKLPERELHGTGGPGYGLPPEPNDQPHKRGALSMAKMPRESNSTRDFNDSGSQFFICVADASGLDRRYTVFGEIYRGVEVLDKIVALPRDERDNPLEPVEMTITVKE